MLLTQLLIGDLNMRKGYAMYYHAEMSEISHVNLQIGLCYLLSMRWFSLEEERVMQKSNVSISLSF